MKAKQMITACALLLTAVCPAHAQALSPTTDIDTDTLRHARISTQGDSIIIRRGSGDLRIRIYEKQEKAGNPDGQKEVELFEGVYLEKADADKRTFLDALPFIPKKKKYYYDPHCSGVFIGYSWMADDFLSFSSDNPMELNLSQSWEFGFNLLTGYHSFKRNPHWGINTGISWGYRSFSFDGNHALLKEEGSNNFAAGDEETTYSKSRLRHFFFRIPVLLEWQQSYNNLFFNIGPEFEIRHGVKSFSHINGGKKQTIGKGMYVRPVGVNLLAQAGYGNFGVYLRYSINDLFQKDKGPKVSPYSFGIAWYW